MTENGAEITMSEFMTPWIVYENMNDIWTGRVANGVE